MKLVLGHHDVSAVSTKEETDVTREEEIHDNGEVAEHGRRLIAETGSGDEQMEDTEEQMAGVPFRPRDLNYNIATPAYMVLNPHEWRNGGTSGGTTTSSTSGTLGIG